MPCEYIFSKSMACNTKTIVDQTTLQYAVFIDGNGRFLNKSTNCKERTDYSVPTTVVDSHLYEMLQVIY